MEVESDILNEIIKCKTYHKHFPAIGERAWLAEGEEIDVIYWDSGNSWCDILDVIPKNAKTRDEQLKAVKKFYKKLRRELEELEDDGYF